MVPSLSVVSTMIFIHFHFHRQFVAPVDHFPVEYWNPGILSLNNFLLSLLYVFSALFHTFPASSFATQSAVKMYSQKMTDAYDVWLEISVSTASFLWSEFIWNLKIPRVKKDSLHKPVLSFHFCQFYIQRSSWPSVVYRWNNHGHRCKSKIHISLMTWPVGGNIIQRIASETILGKNSEIPVCFIVCLCNVHSPYSETGITHETSDNIPKKCYARNGFSPNSLDIIPDPFWKIIRSRYSWDICR